MKQNIFGAILFSVIVGTAVYISASLVTLPNPWEVKRNFSNREISCEMPEPVTKRELAKVKVNQAVLNPKTNQLNTSLTVERFNSSTGHLGVTYHFFVKEGAATQYLSSETVVIEPNFNEENKANHEIISSYNWLDNFDTKNNLYVIAESSYNGFSRRSSIPRFDESIAAPVLLMNGKK